MGKDPVQQGQRPHDELGVILPEGKVADRIVRIQVTVRDEVPGLLILREVRGERETAVKQRAPAGETGQLESQHQVADPAHLTQVTGWRVGWLMGWRVGWLIGWLIGWRGAGRGGSGLRHGCRFAHQRNLTARMGEYPYG